MAWDRCDMCHVPTQCRRRAASVCASGGDQPPPGLQPLACGEPARSSAFPTHHPAALRLMPFNEKDPEKDPYEHLPHHGKVFIENGKESYWNFSSAQVGQVDRGTMRGWRPFTAKGAHFELSVPIETPHEFANWGNTPVQFYEVPIFGDYYDIPFERTCVEARQIPEGRITKWVNTHRDNIIEKQKQVYEHPEEFWPNVFKTPPA